MLIFRFDNSGCALQCPVDGCDVNRGVPIHTPWFTFLYNGRTADVIVKIFHLNKGWFDLRPGHLELLGCLDSTPFLFSHHSDEVLDAYDFYVGYMAD